jgi:hypothetical protein
VPAPRSEPCGDVRNEPRGGAQPRRDERGRGAPVKQQPAPANNALAAAFARAKQGG